VRTTKALLPVLLGAGRHPALPVPATERDVLRRLLRADIFAFVSRATLARTAALAAAERLSEQRWDRQWRVVALDAQYVVGYLLHTAAWVLPFRSRELTGEVLASLRATSVLHHGAHLLVSCLSSRLLSHEVGCRRAPFARHARVWL
jgi:hypothetical protein